MMNSTTFSSDDTYNAVIAGTGSFIPSKILTNEDFTKIIETSDDWITSRTGIKTRHIASDDETTAILATKAAKKALEAAELDVKDLELIVVATITPEMVFPSTACFVQDMLGAYNAWAFDLMAACSGFVYGLSVIQQFISSGRYKNALVMGAETLSKITDYEDRGSCILFGDGAGAVVVQGRRNGAKGIMYSTSSSDGGGWKSLTCQAHGSRYPASKPLDDPKKIYMSIHGREVYQLAVRRIVEMVNECLEKCELDIDDISVFIPHQMNARIIESVAKRLKLRNERVFINIDKYGNTSAASIPIALDECVRGDMIKSGDIVLLVAFGGGLTWGANVIEF